jgi:hypothetical protein
LAVPGLAAACPVCFDAQEEARVAYLATTAFLSALPLALAGGAALWLRGRLRDRDRAPAPPADLG